VTDFLLLYLNGGKLNDEANRILKRAKNLGTKLMMELSLSW
jgi:hypothetical protein